MSPDSGPRDMSKVLEGQGKRLADHEKGSAAMIQILAQKDAEIAALRAMLEAKTLH